MRIAPVILALTTVIALGAAAEDAYDLRPGGAEVYWTTATTAVEFAGVAHDLETSRLMVDYSEAANDWLYIGLSVGLTFDSAETQPLVANTDPAGYVFGLFTGVRFLELGGFALTAEARYLRDYSNGEDDLGSESSLHFAETSGRFGAMYRWQMLELQAGAYSLRLSGDVDSIGTVVGTAEMAEVDQSGAYGIARFKIDGGYALGLRAESGARDSLTFSFSARF